MKTTSKRSLDPRAQAAIDHLTANNSYYVGPILVRCLPAAIPIKGDRHSWRDAVTVFLLSELMGVHRVSAAKTPFWSGAMYRVDRRQLAGRFGCDPDDLSTSLQWLKALGLVHVCPRPNIDDTGKPCGTMVYAAPRMDRIKQMLDFFDEQGRPMTAGILMESDPLQGGSNSSSTVAEVPVKDVPTRAERSPYLNCAKAQQKHDDEGVGETSTQQREHPVNVDRRRRVEAGGGGEADDDQRAQVPVITPPPSERARPVAAEPPAGTKCRTDQSPSSSVKNGNGHVPAPPIWPVPVPPVALRIETEDDKKAWQRAARFCHLWEQAITRSNDLPVCKTTPSDHKKAFSFFKQEPQMHPYFVLAAAINAWELADEPNPRDGWDKLYHTRISTDLQAFLRSYASGKILGEIKRQSVEVNAWEDLRRCFTQSELIFFGWPRNSVPIAPLDDEEIWENDPCAPKYYRKRHLPLAPEVTEAEKLRDLQQKASSSADPQTKT